MNKSEQFDSTLQELAKFAKAISHPARLAILKHLAEARSCISGDISDQLPLSRTTVSQHLKELKRMGLIHGEIEGLTICYCLCQNVIKNYLNLFETFFSPVMQAEVVCNPTEKPIRQ